MSKKSYDFNFNHLYTYLGWLQPERHNLRPEHPNHCHRHRGAQQLRPGLHRGNQDNQGA